MPREKHYEFYAKFDALDRFVKSQPIITDGEAQILIQEEDGFAAWLISKEPLKKLFLLYQTIIIRQNLLPYTMKTVHAIQRLKR